LSFPFAQGRWVILQGGRGVLNHHRRVAEQAGALDLVRLGSRGATVDALYRHALGAFPAYGSTVLAPCDGVVLATRDGLPDQGLERPRLAPAAGNHVRIDTGSEQILLAHLLPGSLLVDVGQRVTRGQPIGQVGNSGNTSEPHLHLHAERDGVGLQLQFERVRGPLTRSRVINAR
jgi:murein DD-endopeptidase MepM/ murein hydrolase activator NlpD